MRDMRFIKAAIGVLLDSWSVWSVVERVFGTAGRGLTVENYWAPIIAFIVGTALVVWARYCSACHGPDAKGLKGLGKDLTHNDFIKGMTDEQFLHYVNTGRSVDDPRNTTGIPMPPKGGNPALKDQEIMDIIAHVRTLQ